LKLLAKSPKDMWNEDLDQFLEAWEQDCIQREEMHSSDSKGKKVKRKQAVLQTRKSLGGKKGSDDDDDFVPIKPAATKRKLPAPKPVKSTVKEEDLSESEQKDGVKAKEIKAVKTIKATNENSKPKRKTVVRKKVVEDSESEDDLFLDDAPPAKKAPIRTVPTKAKIESDDEMEVDRPKTKAQMKGKENDNTKRKSPDSEEESDEFYTRPAKKQKETQATVTEYFGKASGSKLTQRMKPASPPKAKAQAAMVDSDYEELPRAPESRRTGRRKYVELVSSSSE